MPTRKAHARWEGSLETAQVTVSPHDGGFRISKSQALAGTEITL